MKGQVVSWSFTRTGLETHRMAEVDIYTTPFCPYCHRAKALLERKGVAFNEIDVMMAPSKRAEMRERAGGANTVPQVFIDGRHIGGSDELLELEALGKLDAVLNGEKDGERA